jgi:hypothetical protein
MLGHGMDQFLFRLPAGKVGVGRVPRAQQIACGNTQQTKNLADLALRERLSGVLTITIGNTLLPQQGDRLAASTSGAGADQLDGLNGLAQMGLLSSIPDLSPGWPSEQAWLEKALSSIGSVNGWRESGLVV